MKNTIFSTLAFAIIILASCGNQNTTNNNTVENDTLANDTKIYKAIFVGFLTGEYQLFSFYANNNGFPKFLVINDNNEPEWEIFRNPENFGKYYELKTSGNDIERMSELEQFNAGAIVSATPLPEDAAFKAEVKERLYQEFTEDLTELELPFEMNESNFEEISLRKIHLPDEYYWLFVKTEGAYKNVVEEYSYTEGNTYMHENELFYSGKIMHDSPDFDILMFAELPFISKLGAEGTALTYRLMTVSKTGEKISELVFAQEYTVADDSKISGLIESSLQIKIVIANEEKTIETTSYKITKEGKIIKN